MAIIKCEKCGKQYSDKAPECPYCAKAKQKEASPKAMALSVVAVLIFIAIGSAFTPSTSNEKGKSKPINLLTKSMAYTMSQKFVKDRLKAPASAEFPWSDEATIKKTGPGEFMVLAYVDAQNAFGAQIRNHYACKLKSDDNGKTWSLVEFSFAH